MSRVQVLLLLVGGLGVGERPGGTTDHHFVDAFDRNGGSAAVGTPLGLVGDFDGGSIQDFDGGGGIDGWNSAAEAFNVTLELVRRGYTEEQIGKLWSGNLLRVWGEVEKVSQKLRKGQG